MGRHSVLSVILEMVSDVVCPWCWLGLRRLKTALSGLGPDDPAVTVRFRPFELDPTIPKPSPAYAAYMKARVGGDPETKARFDAVRDHLIALGREEGVGFDFAALKVRPNSFDAHRLIRWAQGQDRAFEAKEALFEAYFARGEDLADRAVLIRIADLIGLDASLVARLLDEGADADAVRREADQFRRLGVTGVPTYIADSRIAIQGAESPERIRKLIRAAEQSAPSVSAFQ